MRSPREGANHDAGWRMLLQAHADGSFILDSEVHIIWVDDGMARLLGEPAPSLVGRRLSELALEPAECDATLRCDPPKPCSMRIARAGGEPVTLALEVHCDDDVRLGVARDISQQLAVAARLSRSEASFRALIERSPDAIGVHHEGRFVYANSALAALLGWDSASAFIGTPLIDIVHPEDRPKTYARVRLLANEGDTVPFADARLLRKDGSFVSTSVAAVLVVFDGMLSVAAIARDMSEHLRMQRQIMLADRLASLGTLATGVAHEVNNPLTYVGLGLERISARATRILRAPAAQREDIAPHVEEIQRSVVGALDGVQRVVRIVNDLRRFARVGDEPLVRVDVRHALELALAMAMHEIRRIGKLVVETDPSLPQVAGSEALLAQVFLNLILNAIQSFEDLDGSSITIELRATPTHVRIGVRDNGPGIDNEHLPSLFDPFFTTKPIGTGTGLGLSVCHGIVTSLDGTISVESTLGAGSTFVVELPVPADRS